MWGLEYPLLFGIPKNKPELIDGRTRCAFTFADRAQSEAHFAAWVEALCRWKGVPTPQPRLEDRSRVVEAAGWRLELAPRPIAIEAPFDTEVFISTYRMPWRRDLWEGQPPGHETGWEDTQRHW